MPPGKASRRSSTLVKIVATCLLYVWAESKHVFEVPLSNTRLELRHFKLGLSTAVWPDAVLRPNRVLVAAHRQKLSVPQAAPSKIAAVKRLPQLPVLQRREHSEIAALL